MTTSAHRAQRAGGLAIVAALGAAWTTASAAPSAPKVEAQRAAVLKAITDCRAVTTAEDRLACYDKAVDAFDKAEAKGQVIVVDREQVQAVRRQSFGFNIPSIAIFSKGARPEELDRVTIELRSAHQSGDGKWVMTSTDDAVWRQTDDQALAMDPHAGSTVMIKNGMLGSFFCTVDKQVPMRCMRDH
jgi:hypothetical protein